jgi:aromatic ring hydroxylase
MSWIKTEKESERIKEEKKNKKIDDKAFQTAVELLSNLYDLQNGPPLERYKDEWRLTMDEIEQFLEEYDEI